MIPAEKVLKILNLEDSFEDSDCIQAVLHKIGIPFLFERVVNKEELIEALYTNTWDFVISEYRMSALNAGDALKLIHDMSPDVPFILVSGGIGEECVADMMRLGIEDYVSKCRLERLVPVVKRIIRTQESRTKEMNARIDAQKAHAAREQMLAIVSHDIKNPLSAIQLEVQMLLRVSTRYGQSILSEEVKIQATRIMKTTDRLKLLINDLLDKSKTENSLSTVTKEEIETSKLFQEVMDATRPLIQEKGIQLRLSIPNIKIHLDYNKMFQVLINLISNGLNFTPAGGTISLGVEEHEHELVFHVSDTGPGLKAEELPNVFEKYWTGKLNGYNGTGLGLFICKTIVEAHGGHILVENLAQGGAHFSFTIPKVVNCAEKIMFPYLENKKDSRPKVMIIDDDEDLREVMAWALAHEGYAVQAFGDPIDAVDFLKRGRNVPELILADYHMHGMKGGEFLAIKNTIPGYNVRNCPVVMISASPNEVERDIPRQLYREIITKPVDLSGLVDNMKRFIN